jgi:hypothetical protein
MRIIHQPRQIAVAADPLMEGPDDVDHA